MPVTSVDHLHLRMLLALVLICSLTLCCSLTRSGSQVVAAQQSESEARTQQQSDRAVVVSAIQDALQQGSGTTTDGVKFSTYLPPSEESIVAVQRLGDRAIPILAEFLWSKDDRECWVVIRLLGSLGGARIVPPLEEVARKYPAPRRRILAIRRQSSAPWEIASPIIRESAEHDPDSGVRKTAKDILGKHIPQ